jgi:Glucose-6-phosphate dehydrogenase, C-terminal domain
MTNSKDNLDVAAWLPRNSLSATNVSVWESRRHTVFFAIARHFLAADPALAVLPTHDNWRWQDVPFYLRTAKRLSRQASGITIQFRGVPQQSFPAESTLAWKSSRMVMSIQPDEGIVLRFLVGRRNRKGKNP